jgi:SAM-dependent methyltransferase
MSENVGGLLKLMAAYQQSEVLFSFVELEIAEILDGKKLAARTVAREKKIDVLAMERFLNSCVTVGLLERDGNKYSNSGIAEKFLLKDGEFFLGGQIARHRKRSLPAWSKLTKNLKKWKYGEDEKSAPESSDQGAEAMAEQHNLALFHGFELAKAFDFSGSRKLLDMGGGTGAMSIALCKTYPKLEAVIFDLPENIKVAKKFVSREKLSKRISLVAGDFKEDELPKDFDVALLANLMAVADASENKKLLKELYRKLPDGGACILSGWVIDDSHLAPPLSVLFCLEDICWNAPDVERDETVYAEWLKKAGFAKIESQTYLEPTKMICGFKTHG